MICCRNLGHGELKKLAEERDVSLRFAQEFVEEKAHNARKEKRCTCSNLAGQ